MNIFQNIQEKIGELRIEGCQDKNIMIAMSPTIYSMLLEELKSIMPQDGEAFKSINQNLNIVQICGFDTFIRHPYDEILIYDYQAKNNPALLRKITMLDIVDVEESGAKKCGVCAVVVTLISKVIAGCV